MNTFFVFRLKGELTYALAVFISNWDIEMEWCMYTTKVKSGANFSERK